MKCESMASGRTNHGNTEIDQLLLRDQNPDIFLSYTLGSTCTSTATSARSFERS